jgi:hypothetical protein
MHEEMDLLRSEKAALKQGIGDLEAEIKDLSRQNDGIRIDLENR